MNSDVVLFCSRQSICIHRSMPDIAHLVSNGMWYCEHLDVVPSDMKGYICQSTNWQIHPFISKGWIYWMHALASWWVFSSLCKKQQILISLLVSYIYFIFHKNRFYENCTFNLSHMRMIQLSLYAHQCGLKPHSFHFIFVIRGKTSEDTMCLLACWSWKFPQCISITMANRIIHASLPRWS